MKIYWLKSSIRFLVQLSMVDEFCKEYIKYEDKKIVMVGNKKYKMPFKIESRKLQLKIYFCDNNAVLKKISGISNQKQMKKYFFVAVDAAYLEWMELLVQQGVPAEHIGVLPLFLTDNV